MISVCSATWPRSRPGAGFFHLETGEHRIFEPPTGWGFGGANPMAGDTTLLEAVNDSNPDLRNIIRFDITDLPLARAAAP